MRKGRGLAHGSKLDVLVWEEYRQRGDELTAEAMDPLLNSGARADNPGIILEYVGRDLPEGKDRPVAATARANQS